MTVSAVLRQAARPAPARSAAVLRAVGAFLVRWRVGVAPIVAVAVLLLVPALTEKGVVVADLLGVGLVAVGLEAAIALKTAEQDLRTHAARPEAVLDELAARVESALAALMHDLERTAGGGVGITVHVAPPKRGADASLVREAWSAGTARRSTGDGSGTGSVVLRVDARDGSGPVGALVVAGFAPDAALRRLRGTAPWQRLAALLESGALAG